MTKRRFGPWEGERFAEGGQAVVYLVTNVEDEQDDEQYILKKLKNPKRIDRFKREAEVLHALDHPNVARVIDFDLDGNPSYFVMPYYRGGNLASAEPFRDRSLSELMDLFGQICDGVEAAHGKGVLHRDLKPENLFLDTDRKGNAVVGDFGLCLVSDEPRLTGTSEAVGARFYMAPELEDGRPDDCTVRSDIYSLGKVLYWLCSSGRIFAREKHRDADFELVSLTQNIMLEHVNEVLLDRMIVQDPAGRFGSMSEFRGKVEEVKQLISGGFTPIPGPGEPIPDRVPIRCRHCGRGSYQRYDRDDSHAFRSSLREDWITVVCNYCGHIETFRPDLAKKVKQPSWECPGGHDHYTCSRCAAPAVPVGETRCERCGRVSVDL